MDTKILIGFLSVYFLVMLLMVIAVVWLFITIKTHNASYQATLELQAQQHQHQLLLSKIETQEQAFANIATELHDNVGQQLSYIKIQLAQEPRPIPEHTITTAVDGITLCLQDIRGLARSLNGEYMLANGLLKGIEDFIANSNALGRTQSTCSIIGEAVFLQQDAETILFRIIQEAFNNIMKHAQASTASLQLIFLPQQLQLIITDNGKGFVPVPTKTTGLLNIQSRVQLLQGTTTVSSSLGVGTTLHIAIPIKHIIHA
jgi:signal transduction histidine kinase